MRGKTARRLRPRHEPSCSYACRVFYRNRHPSGGDALLVVEVGDTERNPREKMRAQPDAPIAISRGQQTVAFEDVSFAVEDVFAGLVWTTNQ